MDLESKTASWWHETRRLMLLYMAAGISFVPFGIAYGLLVLAGWDSLVLVIFLLLAGFIFSRWVWHKVEMRLQDTETPNFSVYLFDANYALMLRLTKQSTLPYGHIEWSVNETPMESDWGCVLNQLPPVSISASNQIQRIN